MAKHGIYQKLERFLIKSFCYICEGLVLVHRHFMKPRHVVGNCMTNITHKINLLWNRICYNFGINKSLLKMAKTSKNIFVRKFSGSSVSVGSPFGKILINSVDSKAVASAVRATIKGEEQTIKLSESTLKNIELAKAE